MSSVGHVVQVSKWIGRDLLGRCKHITHQMFNKYLLLTNVGISASLSFAGDLIQQYYEMLQRKDRTWDRGRTFRMTAAGVTVGTFCHYWYQYLDRRFPERTLKIVLKKVAVDQLICSPIYITIFFATTCALERTTFKEFKEEVIHKGWRLYLAEWFIWPPAQIFNFYVLPPRFRVLYDNTISLGYDIFTSYVKNEIPVESAKNDDRDGDKHEDTSHSKSDDNGKVIADKETNM